MIAKRQREVILSHFTMDVVTAQHLDAFASDGRTARGPGLPHGSGLTRPRRQVKVRSGRVRAPGPSLCSTKEIPRCSTTIRAATGCAARS